jgi:Uncharacterised nucleotidyltransferase
MRFRAALAIIDRCLAVAASTAKLAICRQTIWDDRTDWLAVFSLANQHLVTPALWTAFSRYELCQQLPEDVGGYLLLLHTRNAERNKRIREQCIQIGRTLSAAGLRAVLLKGASWLFDGNLEAASDRMMRDIDLLVTSDNVEAAVRALVASGYKDSGESLVEVGHYHYAPLLPSEGEASVEIHRDLARRIDLLPASEVITSACEVAPGLLLPNIHHRIAHNVIHAQILNGDFVGGIVNLRDTLDLARLLVNSGAEADWVCLADEARARGFFRYLSGAVQVSHRVLNSPLPPPLADYRGKLHAWRCIHQRGWPSISKVAEKFGILSRALAWDRDAYALNITSRSLRSHLLVNKRRVRRAKAFLDRAKSERDSLQ